MCVYVEDDDEEKEEIREKEDEGKEDTESYYRVNGGTEERFKEKAIIMQNAEEKGDMRAQNVVNDATP